MIYDIFMIGVIGMYIIDGCFNGVIFFMFFLVILDVKSVIVFYWDVFGVCVVDVIEFEGVVVYVDFDFGFGFF